MPFGCRRRCRLRVVLALGAVLAFPAAIPAASPAGEAAPRATATARITLVVPDPAVRRAVAAHCRDDATVGYVPIVRVAPGAMDLPADGRFVRCASGDTVFLVPGAG